MFTIDPCSSGASFDRARSGVGVDVEKGNPTPLLDELLDDAGADAVGPAGNQHGSVDERRVAGVVGVGGGTGIDRHGTNVTGAWRQKS